MRISQPNYEKMCWKGAPFWKFICEVPPPPTQVVGPRGTQMILISSVYGMHRYGNLANHTMKKVLEKGTFLKRQSQLEH